VLLSNEGAPLEASRGAVGEKAPAILASLELPFLSCWAGRLPSNVFLSLTGGCGRPLALPHTAFQGALLRGPVAPAACALGAPRALSGCSPPGPAGSAGLPLVHTLVPVHPRQAQGVELGVGVRLCLMQLFPGDEGGGGERHQHHERHRQAWPERLRSASWPARVAARRKSAVATLQARTERRRGRSRGSGGAGAGCG